jgi:hypothetical protein
MATKKAAPKAKPSAASKVRTAKGAHLGFRVDEDIVAMLDARAEQLRAERPGTTVTRSDVAREILYRALRDSGRGHR